MTQRVADAVALWILLAFQVAGVSDLQVVCEMCVPGWWVLGLVF
jgi:hypothetical protein